MLWSGLVLDGITPGVSLCLAHRNKRLRMLSQLCKADSQLDFKLNRNWINFVSSWKRKIEHNEKHQSEGVKLLAANRCSALESEVQINSLMADLKCKKTHLRNEDGIDLIFNRANIVPGIALLLQSKTNWSLNKFFILFYFLSTLEPCKMCYLSEDTGNFMSSCWKFENMLEAIWQRGFKIKHFKKSLNLFFQHEIWSDLKSHWSFSSFSSGQLKF